MEKRILEDAPLSKLELMMESGEMKIFMLAVNELSAREDREAYELLKKYTAHKDKYRRLYVFKKIFFHPASAELIPWLEENIASGEEYFSENGLMIVGDLGIKINREILLAGVEREAKEQYADGINALRALEVNEENFHAIIRIFEKASGSNKEFSAKILCEKYLPEKADELFTLFVASDFAKVRIIAARIGRKYGFDLEKMKYDENGHVRKIAEMNLGELEFLRKYMKDYRVEISEDLESAVVVNPYKDEHITIEFEKSKYWEEYTVILPDTHAHFGDSEDAEEYIDEFISREFSKNENVENEG